QHDAALRAGGDVDIVVADAEAGDDAQPVRAGEGGRRYLRGQHEQGIVTLHLRGAQPARVLRQELPGDAGAMVQQAQADVPEPERAVRLEKIARDPDPKLLHDAALLPPALLRIFGRGRGRSLHAWQSAIRPGNQLPGYPAEIRSIGFDVEAAVPLPVV